MKPLLMRRNVRESAVLLLAAALLSVVACLNGYPMVYADTGTYLTQALELEGAPDRPPYYSLLIFPFHFGYTLWFIPFFQAAFAAYLILRTFQAASPGASLPAFLLAVLILTACSSLPWFTSQIMPDLFTGAIVLNVFILGFHPGLGRTERLFLLLLLTVSISVHFSHFAVAFSSLAAVLTAHSLRSTMRQCGRIAIEVCMAASLAFASFALYNYALVGRPMLSAMGPIFLLARSLEDGPARQYLKMKCPDPRLLLCRRIEAIPASANEFLWEQSSPLQDLYHTKKWSETLDEARLIVKGAVSAFPRWQLRRAARNFLRQLVMTDTGDFDFDYQSRMMKVTKAISDHFPGELGEFLSSAQARKTIPLHLFVPFHRITALIAFLWSCVMSLRLWRKGQTEAPALFMTIIFGLIANAFMTGVLSGPMHRYGSRMIWLIPLALLFMLQVKVKDA